MATLAGVSVLAQGPAPSPALPSAPLPAAPGSRIIQLTRRPGYFSEPSVAINPVNPSQIAAAIQVPASVFVSDDAGAHWIAARGTAPANYRVSGDVSIAYDILGHAFLCYIAFDKLGTPQYWAHDASRNGIFVRRSLDGGHTWSAPAALDEQPTRPVMPFEDKPYVVADNNPTSPYAGSLYIGWTEFTLEKSVILLSRSNDGGVSWSPPYEISTHEGLPRDDNGSVEGFSAVAGPDGMLYAVWADGSRIVMTTSDDGGRTFSPSRKILDVSPPYFGIPRVARTDGGGANGFPQISADPRTGRIYAAWSDYRNGDVDVFCAASSDRGSTWTSPVRVNDDPLHNGADQFFQWLAVDPSDGSVNVVFYDRRQDRANRRAEIVLARSTDAGKTFRNYAWRNQPVDPASRFIGDYTALAALGGRIYGAWTVPKPAAARARSPRSRGSVPQAPRDTVVELGIADFRAEAK